MPAGPNDFNSYPGEDPNRVPARAGTFAGRLSPLRFTEYPTERLARGGVVRPQPEARRSLDALLGGETVGCPNKPPCGWTTVVPPCGKTKAARSVRDKAVQLKVRAHKRDCDFGRKLAKEKGQSPEALAEGRRPVPPALPRGEVIPTRDDIVEIVSEVLDQKLAGFVEQVKRAAVASKPPRRKRAESAPVARSQDAPARPVPVPRIPRVKPAVAHPAKKSDQAPR